MTTDEQQVDEVGAWARQKLGVLEKYLNAYTTIMRRQGWCRGYHYIDAYAGSGQPKIRDEEIFIDGSPRIALQVKYPFTSYTFIEIFDWRIQRLEALKSEYPHAAIRVLQGDCNRVLLESVTSRITQPSFERAIIFLDPFRMNLEWATIEAIAATRAIEVFINVPTMSLNRETLLNDPERIMPTKIEQMNRFWGTEDWRQSIYETVDTLFGPREYKIQKTTAQHLGRLYHDRLESVFPYVTPAVPVCNSTGQPIYCLVFAGPNGTGGSIANDLLNDMAEETRLKPTRKKASRSTPGHPGASPLF